MLKPAVKASRRIASLLQAVDYYSLCDKFSHRTTRSKAANQWPALDTHSPVPARLNGVESTTIRILEVVLV